MLPEICFRGGSHDFDLEDLHRMVSLSEASLEWALKHLHRFGDSDILAVPMEYHAIVGDWIQVKKWLLAVDVAVHEPRPLLRFLVPKPEGGYRVATRLDPLDAFIYTALVYDFAPAPRDGLCTMSYMRRPSKASRVGVRAAGAPSLVVGRAHAPRVRARCLACPRCGGRLRLIASVEDPRAIREILDALALFTEPMDRAPPPGTPIDSSPAVAVYA